MSYGVSGKVFLISWSQRTPHCLDEKSSSECAIDVIISHGSILTAIFLLKTYNLLSDIK